MNIKFNEVTWYSKLLAVILFLAVAGLFFYFGGQYVKITNGLYDQGGLICRSGDPYKEGYESASKNNGRDLDMCQSDLSRTKEEFNILYKSKFPLLNFQCDAGKKFTLEYGESSYSPAPGAISIPQYGLYLDLGNKFTDFLSEVSFTSSSASAQYLNYNKTIFFQTDFDKAFIRQNGVVTYKNCVVVE